MFWIRNVKKIELIGPGILRLLNICFRFIFWRIYIQLLNIFSLIVLFRRCNCGEFTSNVLHWCLSIAQDKLKFFFFVIKTINIYPLYTFDSREISLMRRSTEGMACERNNFKTLHLMRLREKFHGTQKQSWPCFVFTFR